MFRPHYGQLSLTFFFTGYLVLRLTTLKPIGHIPYTTYATRFNILKLRILPIGSMCDTYSWHRRSIFIRHKSVFSSERMLHRDYDRKGSVAKKKKKLSWVCRGLAPRRTDWRWTASRKVILILNQSLKSWCQMILAMVDFRFHCWLGTT
jgi:hypothetical protein